MALLTNYSEIIELCQKAECIDDIYSICEIVSEKCGFDQFMYGCFLPTSLIHPELLLINGYRKDWWNHYSVNDYMKVDPIVHFGANNIIPLRWHQLSHSSWIDERTQQLMSESKEFGLVSGISIPVHTPKGETAMLSFSSSETPGSANSLMQEVEHHLMVMAYHIHDSVMRIVRKTSNNNKEIVLTARERECLLWSAEGKTSDETAIILHLSESTVRFHLNKAAKKLGVRTRRHAIARAIHLGLITPNIIALSPINNQSIL